MTPPESPTLVDAGAQERRVGLRVVPTPDWDPPFDDGGPRLPPPGRHRGLAVAEQPSLDLTFVLAGDVPAVPEAPRLRLVPPPPPRRALLDDDEERAPSSTPTAELPDPRGWAGRLALAAVEVLAGTRPLPQLRRWTSDEVYGQLRRQSHHGRVAERRPSAQPHAPRVQRVTRVRAVRVCEPGDGVAEASVVVDDGSRVRALALRFEGIDGRWRCTELQTP